MKDCFFSKYHNNGRSSGPLKMKTQSKMVNFFGEDLKVSLAVKCFAAKFDILCLFCRFFCSRITYPG